MNEFKKIRQIITFSSNEITSEKEVFLKYGFENIDLPVIKGSAFCFTR